MLGISEDKFEAYPKEPVTSGPAKLIWKRQKSFSCDLESVVACDVIEKRDNEKKTWVFRLVVLDSATPAAQYKKHEFEAQEAVASEIHSKVKRFSQL